MYKLQKAIAVLFFAGQILCQSDKTQQPTIQNYDPQLLNYQLQQLALQQFSDQHYASQIAGKQSQQQQQQIQQYQQSVQYAPPQYQPQSVQPASQQLTQQDYDAARLLQTKLFEPYQGRFDAGQPQPAQYSVQQQGPITVQQQQQQLPKQQLLGVAYSSAADASKTSFTGYGIKYSF